MADPEPQPGLGRPTGDMTDSHGARRADHPSHDVHLLAAAADRTAAEATRTAAERQAAECDECASLLADLRALSAGLASLPRTLPVSRDYRISPERAARLRSGGWRRVFDGFRRPAALRPLASALTALGVAGLILTVGLPAMAPLAGGSAAGLPSTTRTSTAAPAPVLGPATSTGQDLRDQSTKSGASGAPEAQPGGGVSGAAASPAAGYAAQTPAGGGNSAPSSGTGTLLAPINDLAAPAGPSLLAIAAWLSLALLVVGLGLFVVVRIGGRDPAA